MAYRGEPEEVRVRRALEILGPRWNGAILHTLLSRGEMRFGELRSRVSGITDKVLSARLQDLELLGIVDRRIEGGRPPHSLYRVTRTASGLGAIFAALAAWDAP